MQRNWRCSWPDFGNNHNRRSEKQRDCFHVISPRWRGQAISFWIGNILQDLRLPENLCLTLCDPMNHSMPGLSIHHQLPEFTHIHVHWVSDAIQPSYPLSSPSPPAPKSLPASKSFPMSQLFAWGGQSPGVSASASFLPKKSQGWSPSLAIFKTVSAISCSLQPCSFKDRPSFCNNVVISNSKQSLLKKHPSCQLGFWLVTKKILLNFVVFCLYQAPSFCSGIEHNSSASWICLSLAVVLTNLK